MRDPAWEQIGEGGEEPQRLDRLVAEALSLSRQQVRRLLASGGIRVDDRLVDENDKGRMVATGERVEVRPTIVAQQNHPIAQAELDVPELCRDPGWVVVNKPAGMAVHPLTAGQRGTVLNNLIARYPQMLGAGEGGLRSGVVHRLDVGTSGTLVFALDDEHWRMLRTAFTQRTIVKQYLAIVHGRLSGERREQWNLVVAQHRPARVRVAAEQVKGSRPCLLRWHAEQTFADATLLRVDLETGFLHQIRAIFAHLGHPLLGDAHYGAKPMPAAARPMLHAARLATETFDAHAPLPADMLAELQRLRGD